MAVSCYISGRRGNAFFSLAQMLAYAKKYDLEYVVPSNADAYKHHEHHNKNPFWYIKSTGTLKYPFNRFEEANIHTQPFYQAIPKMDNTVFFGYFQSFLYFDQYRDYILEKFDLSEGYIEKGITAIHVRRGDCIGSPNFPILSIDYYQNAVKYMQSKGFNTFRLHSDDIRWCKSHFNNKNFPEAVFEFAENNTEGEDYNDIIEAENVITARSTFSLTAAWANHNPSKIVIVPSDEKFPWFKGQNKDLLTGTGFIKMDFEKNEDLILERQY